MNYNNTPPKMTKDQFISKTKEMLKFIIEGYSKHHVSPNIENLSDEECENIGSCTRCNGFLYYESGGNTVDCDSCNQTGLDLDPVFDIESFTEFIEHAVIFGSQPFIELMDCEITEDEKYFDNWNDVNNISVIESDENDDIPI